MSSLCVEEKGKKNPETGIRRLGLQSWPHSLGAWHIITSSVKWRYLYLFHRVESALNGKSEPL